jgi:hypothetical protein
MNLSLLTRNCSEFSQLLSMTTSCLQLLLSYKWLNLSERVILWPTVSRPVCLGVKHPSGAYDQIFITVRQLWVCWCQAPSLTRGQICLLPCTMYNIFTFYMLLCVMHSIT